MTTRVAVANLAVMARSFCSATLVLWLLTATGCETPPRQEQEEQIWERIKLRDLAPPGQDEAPRARLLASVHMDVHVIELPSENIEQLDDVWEILSAQSIRMNSYTAFTKNSFRVLYGRVEIWPQILTTLAQAGGKKAAVNSLVLADNETSDLPIAEIPSRRMVSFVGMDLSPQTVNLGPGLLVLRLRPEPLPWGNGARKIIAYPTFTLALTSAISELQERAKKHEFYFAPAACAAPMGPGDLLVLGPDKYTGEQISLGGLFFNDLAGSLFPDPEGRQPPRRKPAVRVYVLICTAIQD